MVLNKTEIFKGLTSEQFSVLLGKGRPKGLRPKSVLFHQGDAAQSCFLVTRGRLKLTKLNEQGKEVILRYIGCGESTAAIAVLKNWMYPVKELLDRYPQLLQLFIDLGLLCPGCPAEAFHTLPDVAREYQLDWNEFIRRIDRFLEAQKYHENGSAG